MHKSILNRIFNMWEHLKYFENNLGRTKLNGKFTERKVEK